MARHPLGLEGKNLRYRLLLIEALVFVLPFLILFYLFYQKQIHLTISQQILLALILMLILAGLMLLRRIFDRVFVISSQIRQALGDGEPHPKKDLEIDELQQITHAFDKLINRFQDTTTELQQRVFELFSIRELTEAAGKSLDLDALMALLLERALSVSGARVGSVLLVEPDAKHLRVVAAHGGVEVPPKDAVIQIENSIARFVLQNNQPLLVENIETDVRTLKPNDPKYPTPSFLSMPLFVRNNLLAVINLTGKENKAAFSTEDIQILSIMISEISFALENAQLYSEIESQRNRYREQAEALSRSNDRLQQEIAERQRMESALRESEARYRHLIENADDGIFITQHGRMRFPNPKAAALTGQTMETFLEPPLESYIHPDDREQVVNQITPASGKEKYVGPVTFRWQKPDGEISWVQLNTVPIQWEGKPAVLNFLRDISMQKRLEAQFYQAQKMESIGTLAGGIAHEFNNLMMGIQGNAQLMRLEVDRNSMFYQRLNKIEALIKRGSLLTRQLLGFAQRGKYDIQPTDLNRLIVRSAAIFGRTRKEIAIRTELQDELWTVEADPSQIEQVLMNLYMNAGQAMPYGGDLFIETKNTQFDSESHLARQLAPGRYVRVTVTDTGVGMDDPTLARIFDPFFTTQDMGKSSGLGLAAAYGIIHNHNGWIDAASQKGQGATFSIYLPAVEKAPAEKPPPTEKTPTGTETLLIVDDEEEVLTVNRQLLETLGYTVLSARSGQEALALYAGHREAIDAVILDITMPQMGGKETFQRLRKMNPTLRVLLSSGYSMEGKAKEILEEGGSGFIQKPFRIRDLAAKVRQVLDRRP